MGRSSTASCFKFMTCSGDLAGGDDPAPLESKASPDKGRWSFRKRSSRHSVISEPGFDTNIPETVTNDFHSGNESPVPENPPILEETNEKPSLSATDSGVVDTVHLPIPQSPPRLEQTKETPPLPAVNDPEVSDELLSAELTTNIDNNFQEDIVIVIQSAIRGYLAQKELEKRKNVVKLQATVRGHLVRRQAVGTLRCVQAIIKMQALVRARHGHQPKDKFAVEHKLDEKLQIDSGMKSDMANTPIEKLLSNAFARLLLESAPKTKPIHVSCDPLRSDSAWKWLEKWMVVTSSGIGQQQELNLDKDYQGEKERSTFAASEVVNIVPHTVASISSDSKSSPSESETPVEVEGDLIKKNSAEYEVHISESISNQINSSVANNDEEQSWYESEASEENSESATSIEGKVDVIYENTAEYQINVPVSIPNPESSVAKNDQEQSQCERETSGMIEENMKMRRVEETFDSTTSQVPAQSNATSESSLDNNSAKPGFDMENQECTIGRATCEPQEMQGQKGVFKSRKAFSPVFAAVQSKFEELSSASSAGGSVTYVNRGSGVLSKLVHLQVGSPTKFEEHSMIGNSRSLSQIENSASECGAEISASSMFDLPEGCGVDDEGTKHKVEALEEGNYNMTDGAAIALDNGNMNSDTKFHHSKSDVLQLQKHKESDESLSSTAVAVDSKQVDTLPAESTTSNIQTQVKNLKDTQIHCSSPEGSPRGHVTAPECHRTPSSQISAKTKTSKAENNIHAPKQISQLAHKNSPSNTKNDSGARKSTEHLPKDAKNAKRHNSSGMAKPDHDDHESRDSSSNSLPRYMQATESARAKVQDIISLKSSPDIHDKDDHMKKRHSLPVGDVKLESSPQMQRLAPQTQQSLKRSSTHSPQNSAERRWQR